MTEKQKLMSSLIEDLKNDVECENLKAKRKGILANVGLINHFKLHDLIPNKWFDWKNRADAPIMIIGQDWGPYIALKKYIDDYNESLNLPNFSYEEFLFKGFSSRTEKFILKALNQTYKDRFNKDLQQEQWNNFFFTMAVLYTRQGKHFRGNENFDEKQSQEICFPYVAQQIEIVKPKVIITLGNLALTTVLRKFNHPIEKTLTEYINNLTNSHLRLGDTYLIPCYHPAAHINPNIQIKLWSKLWELIEI